MGRGGEGLVEFVRAGCLLDLRGCEAPGISISAGDLYEITFAEALLFCNEWTAESRLHYVEDSASKATASSRSA